MTFQTKKLMIDKCDVKGCQERCIVALGQTFLCLNHFDEAMGRIGNSIRKGVFGENERDSRK